MIQLVKRKKLDVDKYNNCVENAMQSNIYGLAWYLDIVCDNWSVLVLNDYEAVMPIPWRRKLLIKYTYQPFWVIQLGIYSQVVEDENEFLIELFSEFKYVNLRMNPENSFSMFLPYQTKKLTQFVSYHTNFNLFDYYNRNRKRELKKAEKSHLKASWDDSPKVLIDLFKLNVGKRVKKIKDKDYLNLYKLMSYCLNKDLGYLLTVYDEDEKLVSGAFFVKNKLKITEVVCSSDFKNRSNGANTFMNHEAIIKFQKDFKIFNFGGSSMENIQKYYKSFGGKDEFYSELTYNKLPRVLRFFKR